ncbi:hypothetical protein F0U61_29880 [Archangium violaceum]|uniref:hypothetical protein n=1 Tax=Archangium violaceum TaxID=83451 RepID=UPI002B3150E5|nr:hypothetical protein F0U61_29880 [Archangium violaceum]
MPQGNCHSCPKTDVSLQPRVCASCHTRYFMCTDCRNAPCSGCKAHQWLLLSQCDFEPKSAPIRSQQTSVQDEEEMVEDEEPPAVAVTANTVIGGQSKLTWGEFQAELQKLERFVSELCPEEGIARTKLEGLIQQAEKQRQHVLFLLSSASQLKGLGEQGGIAHLIEEVDYQLLHAADVLREARAQLDAASDDDIAQVGSLHTIEECKERAEAGETLVRFWKVYKSYRAIWFGEKWKTAKLSTVTGGNTFKGETVKLDDNSKGLKNPIAALSKQNIDRLKTLLREDRYSFLQRRKVKLEGRFVELQDEIELLEERRDALLNDPDEEPSPEALDEIDDELELLRDEKLEVDAEATRLEIYLTRRLEVDAERFNTLQRRKVKLEGRFVELQDEIELLKERKEALLNDPNEEPSPEALDEIDDELELLRDEKLEVDAEATRLEIDITKRFKVDARPAALSIGLGLMEDEEPLFEALLNLPYRLKHATNAWYCILNDGRLDSYDEIKRRYPNWQSEFSTNGNIEALGNGGFVFFRLDVGDGAIDTRYGATLVTYDLDLLTRDGWVSMYDQLKPLSSDTMKYLYDHRGQLIRLASMTGTNKTMLKYVYGKAGIRNVPVKSKKENAKPRTRRAQAKEFEEDERYESLEREVPFLDFVFYGREIRLGIALSVLWELRQLRLCGYRRHVIKTFTDLSDTPGLAGQLSAREQFLARLLSRLFRPEGKHPVALRLTRHRPASVGTPEGDGRYNADSTENPKVMEQVRLEQRRKELESNLHVTRQQRGAAKKRAEEAMKSGNKTKQQEAQEAQTLWNERTAKLEKELDAVKKQLQKSPEQPKKAPKKKPDLKVSP